MWIGFITLFPELIEAGMSKGVIGRAGDAGLVQTKVYNPRDFTRDKHRTVDDRPYGGGAGMVMLYEPLRDAIAAARRDSPADSPVVMLSPQGVRFTQVVAESNQGVPGFIFLCGRYEGIDQRALENLVDFEWSIGDFVLSGGEIPALAMADALIRLIPGVLGNSLSTIDESFLDDQLDYPHYTRPEHIDDFSVPEVLLSGDHRRISEYRRRGALTKTYARRPDLMIQKVFSVEQRKLLQETLLT
ncbi:MAG: tRNA (guanosine(37)-N1)-methyltransferase TrmD [Pseudomonadota bacterium]